jgi:hypothetical protein
LCDVSTDTLRSWDEQGRFVPLAKTPKGQRRYTSEQVDSFCKSLDKDVLMINCDIDVQSFIETFNNLIKGFEKEKNANFKCFKKLSGDDITFVLQNDHKSSKYSVLLNNS